MQQDDRGYLLKAPVLLISGETGCGKSHTAHQLYLKSNVFRERWVTVHLASLSENLLESELFGHEKGAFTGAHQARAGYLDKCGEGTLFLDEIGELTLEQQKKLLYLLEERRYCAVGSTREKHFRGRIIAATNRDLPQMVKEGTFRQDLYYRLLVAEYRLPPLRDRKEEFASIVRQCNQQLSKQYEEAPLHFADELWLWMTSYSWKGNIRELKNLLEYFMLRGLKVAKLVDLPPWLREDQKSREEEAISNYNYTVGLERFEKKFFQEVLEHFQGRINETARQIGISKSTLIAKIRKYGINTWEIRSKNFELAKGFV